MNFANNLTVKNKLRFGFAVIILLMIAVTSYSYYTMKNAEIVQTRLLELRFPTVITGESIENGINESLAGLRGYMILGKVPAKAAAMEKERQAGWKKIDDGIATMQQFAKNWTNPQNIQRLKEIETYVEEFRTAQQEVKDISHTDKQIPAFKTLLTEAAPRAGKMVKSITAMIDEESELEATIERKKLLKLLADTRGAFAIGLANIRAYLLSGDVQFSKKFMAVWKKHENSIKQISTYTQIMTTTQLDAWNNYITLKNEFSPLPEKMFKQRSAKDWNLANYWLGTKAAPKAQAIMKILKEMHDNQAKLKEVDKALLKNESQLMNKAIISGSIFALIISIIIVISLTRAIIQPLEKVVKRANAISEGDLTGKTLPVTNNDELAVLSRAINKMSEHLQGIIHQIVEDSKELSEASERLDTIVIKTNQGMEAQLNETDQVITAMDQMGNSVQEVAENAEQASSTAKQADTATSSGHNLVLKNMNGINELAENISTAKETIDKLGNDINSVDSIVVVINEIADQTNLLALNAAIEAARAGEQGRGFAVVADEVRTLASRTQESTEEIRNMLERLKAGAIDAVRVMDAGHEQAQHSVIQEKNACDSIDQVTGLVTSITSMNTQIATAAEQQSLVANEMSSSVAKINRESKTTLKDMQKNSEAVHQISTLSINLQELVSRFKVTSTLTQRF
ncbi:MAG: methyl-accepting chemotaxis protein [Psychromonas sp.]|nr:methyl-accepting chemotaxis protein [Psychromonas sp.]